jgi:hypothetical protein
VGDGLGAAEIAVVASQTGDGSGAASEIAGVASLGDGLVPRKSPGRAKQETALCRTEFAVVASLKTGDGLVPHGIRRVASLKQETALCRTEIGWRLETGTAR